VFDSVAPAAMVLDLPAAEDSGYSSSDNITKVDQWHFFANTPGELAFNVTTEYAPNTRVVTYTFSANASTGCFCFYFPDNAGGLAPDGRQGVWGYQGHFEDLAGNVGADSNLLQILFDSVAPTGTFTINNDTPIINGKIATKDPDLLLGLAFTDGGSSMSEMAFSSTGGAPFDPAEAYGAIGALTLPGPDGVYTVAVLVTDLAGNSLTTTKEVRLDTTGPAITTGGIPNGSSYDLGVTLNFTFGATDVDNATITAVLDGLQTLTSGGAISTNTLAAGIHTIVVTATDGLGNVSQVTVTFEVRASALGLCTAVSDGVASGLVQRNMENPLCTKARSAQAAINRGAYADAKTILMSFISQVYVAQADKKIDAAYAALLAGWATDVISHLP
jgi:hypothetical protein